MNKQMNKQTNKQKTNKHMTIKTYLASYHQGNVDKAESYPPKESRQGGPRINSFVV